MGAMHPLSRRFDVVEAEVRSGLYNQGRGHMLSPAKLGTYEGVTAKKVDHPWNPVRMDMHHFYCLRGKD